MFNIEKSEFRIKSVNRDEIPCQARNDENVNYTINPKNKLYKIR